MKRYCGGKKEGFYFRFDLIRIRCCEVGIVVLFVEEEVEFIGVEYFLEV